jgi:hypothetical protein
MAKKTLKQLEWYQNELKKDSLELDKQKNEFINSIKKMKKTDILPEPPKKLSLWKKILKVLMG